jgi:hypothetical protein
MREPSDVRITLGDRTEKRSGLASDRLISVIEIVARDLNAVKRDDHFLVFLVRGHLVERDKRVTVLEVLDAFH